MPSTEVVIANLALGHCGQSTRITSLAEASSAARACLQFYAQARDETLEAFAWGFARTFAALALVEEDPTTEWAYSYRVPADCLTFRRILSGTRNETRATAVPCLQARDDEGRIVLTDQADAVAEYTVLVDDASQFSPLFVGALGLLLGSYIAPQVTGGDPTNLRAKNYQLYQLAISQAKVKAANESVPDVEPDAAAISARD